MKLQSILINNSGIAELEGSAWNKWSTTKSWKCYASKQRRKFNQYR